MISWQYVLMDSNPGVLFCLFPNNLIWPPLITSNSVEVSKPSRILYSAVFICFFFICFFFIFYSILVQIFSQHWFSIISVFILLFSLWGHCPSKISDHRAFWSSPFTYKNGPLTITFFSSLNKQRDKNRQQKVNQSHPVNKSQRQN